MSVNMHIRSTKLPDVVGRLDYMSNPERQQEKLVAVAGNLDPEFWARLATCSRENFTPREREIHRKDGSIAMRKDKCCEARELMIALPNNILELTEEIRQQKLDALATYISQRTGTACALALHDSHAAKNGEKGNAHVHALFSERVELPEPVIQVASRATFFDEDGKRRYKKSEILDEEGNVRPGCRIVGKGEIISEKYFSEKLPEFKSKEWLAEMKEALAGWINRELMPDQERTVYDPYGPYLAQIHVGNYEGKEKQTLDELKGWNKNVKIFNEMVRYGDITVEEALDYKTRIALSPIQSVELSAIISDVLLSLVNDEDPRKASYEHYADNYVSYGRRTADTNGEAKKRKLRELYRRSRIAWKEYRNESDFIAQAQKKLEAMSISREIDKLKYELGYSDTLGLYNRRQAVREVANSVREGHEQRTEARHEAYADKSAAGKAVGRAYEELKRLKGWTEYRPDGTKVHYKGICKKMNDPRIKAAEEKLDEARWEYQQEKERVNMHKLAVKVEHEYKALAMRLASDPSIPQAEVDRAMQRYQKAALLLQDPTSSVVKSLRHELKDLQRSQRLREEKRKQQLKNAQNKQKQEEINR